MNWFQKIVGFTASTYSSLMESLNGAKAAISVATGLVWAILFAVICVKFFEMLAECEGQSISQRMFYAYKQFRRQFIVYVLVLAAPALIAGFGRIARGNVQHAFCLVNTMDGVAAQADSGLKALVTSWDAIKQSAAAALGICTEDYNAPSRSLEIHNLKASPEAKAARKQLQDVTVQMQKELAGMGSPSPNSPAGRQKAAFEKQIATNQELIKTGDTALKSISPEEQARWAAYQKATMDEATQSTGLIVAKALGVGVTSTAGIVAGAKLGGTQGAIAGGVIGAGTAYGMEGGFSELKQYFEQRVLIPVVAGFFFLICALGAGYFGMAAIKQTIAVASYIVSVWAMVSVGVAIALPVSGLFMLCFLGEKTWHYGQNFISFWFSMIFGTLALATLAALLASAIPVAINRFVAGAMMGILSLSGANSFTSLVTGTVSVVAGFFAAAMVLNFLNSFPVLS